MTKSFRLAGKRNRGKQAVLRFLLRLVQKVIQGIVRAFAHVGRPFLLFCKTKKDRPSTHLMMSESRPSFVVTGWIFLAVGFRPPGQKPKKAGSTPGWGFIRPFNSNQGLQRSHYLKPNNTYTIPYIVFSVNEFSVFCVLLLKLSEEKYWLLKFDKGKNGRYTGSASFFEGHGFKGLGRVPRLFSLRQWKPVGGHIRWGRCRNGA